MTGGEKREEVVPMNTPFTKYYSLDLKVAKYILEIEMAYAKLLFDAKKKLAGAKR